MPRVKIDYVVSFSSETAEAPASNLLANDAGRGRWLCERGEPSCSVLLQLERAVQISSITIGAQHAALVEVLVGRSEKPNEPFQVLVASSVFLSPLESRRGTEGGAETARVRTFSGDQMASEVRTHCWDRVRVVCSQPYNKHCKYGLSFIHIFSPEGDTRKPAPVQALKIPFAVEDQDSDDEFKPGALFAQHRASLAADTTNTGAQIRQATSQALKTQSDSSTKLIRTPIAKPKGDSSMRDGSSSSDRHRETLMYAEEDDKPNEKIDKLVNAHKEQQAKASAEKVSKDDKHRKEKERRNTKEADNSSSKEIKRNERRQSDTQNNQTIKHRQTANDSSIEKDKHREKRQGDREKAKDDRDMTPQSNKRDRNFKDDDRKNKKLKTSDDALRPGPISSTPHTLLSNVVFVLSGYENPRRAAVRDAALAMGAQYRRDWGTDCTHLICAFPNTPKLRTVRSSPNGTAAVVVTAEWVERCAVRRRVLPWQWFATEGRYRVDRGEGASGEDDDVGGEDECDTDDEIEKVLQAKRRRKSNETESKSPEASSSKKKDSKEETLNCSHDSDVTFVKDERIQGNVTVDDSDSDATEQDEQLDDTTPDINSIQGLPSFFDGHTFALHGTSKSTIDVALVRRYVKAYGGQIIEPMDDEDFEVDYVLCLSGDYKQTRARGRTVRADWLWHCHKKRRLCSPGEYALG